MSTSVAPEQIVLPDTLRGDRVLLRPYREADAAAVLEAIDVSRAHLRPWVGWADRYTTLAETRGYCERCAAAWRERSDLSLGIFDAASGGFLGGAGLHKPNWQRRTFEISCWLRVDAAYRGYGTEALGLLADLVFAGLDGTLIKLLSDARNGPTQRLAEKCGYVIQGRVRSGYAAPDGELVDLLVYSLTPEDWLRAGSRSVTFQH